jgi:hypothetical protein
MGLYGTDQGTTGVFAVTFPFRFSDRLDCEDHYRKQEERDTVDIYRPTGRS